MDIPIDPPTLLKQPPSLITSLSALNSIAPSQPTSLPTMRPLSPIIEHILSTSLDITTNTLDTNPDDDPITPVSPLVRRLSYTKTSRSFYLYTYLDLEAPMLIKPSSSSDPSSSSTTDVPAPIEHVFGAPRQTTKHSISRFLTNISASVKKVERTVGSVLCP